MLVCVGVVRIMHCWRRFQEVHFFKEAVLRRLDDSYIIFI